MRTEASEPLVAYNTSNLQGLKNRIIESLDTAVDEEKLQRCLELLSEDEMPCVSPKKNWMKKSDCLKQAALLPTKK